MTIARTRGLIGRALRPGASLAHNVNYLVPVDALTALGRLKDEPHGALVLRAKYAGDSVAAMRAVVLEIAQVLFARYGWVVHARDHYTEAETMDMFASQVCREFFGEPCDVCRGHGVLGQKLDSVRHSMDVCDPCRGRGYLSRPITKHPGFYLRVPCGTCRGNRYTQITETLKAGKLRSCVSCSGSGTIKASLRARGRALKYDHQHIRRVWVDRFDVTLSELRRIELVALLECTDYLYPASR